MAQITSEMEMDCGMRIALHVRKVIKEKGRNIKDDCICRASYKLQDGKVKRTMYPQSRVQGPRVQFSVQISSRCIFPVDII